MERMTSQDGADHRRESSAAGLHDYMTTEEVADYCRTSPETVRWWHKVGKGPHSFKVGRRRLYARADVEAWMQAHRSEGAGANAAA